MDELTFEWDENKNEINKVKHKLSFEEASTVFYDVNAVLFDDPDHSEDESRFLILGYSETAKLCIVSHCYRDGDTIRLISARKATKSEQHYYNDHNDWG